MKPYIFKQVFCIITLIIFTYVTHSYIQNKTIQIENNTLKGIILVLAAALLLFICNQLLYNYGQKETKFMQHKLWDKMFIVIFALVLLLRANFTLGWAISPFHWAKTALRWANPNFFPNKSTDKQSHHQSHAHLVQSRAFYITFSPSDSLVQSLSK